MTSGPDLEPRRVISPRAALTFILAVFLALALLVATLTPPWESVDEPDHVQNIETLVGGHLYQLKPGSGLEAHQPPLYYAGLAAWQRLLGGPPQTPAPVKGCNFFAQKCQWLYRHDLARDGLDQRLLTLLRLPGLLLGALTVLLTAVAARSISGNRWTPVVAAATMAFVPRFIFLSGVVNNDNLAITFGAGATALAMHAITPRGATRRAQTLVALAMGALLGALVLTKDTALTLAPAMACAIFISAAGRREGLRLVAIMGAAALLVSSPWLIHNIVSHGEPLALSATHDYLAKATFFPGHGALIYFVGPTLTVLFSTMPLIFYRFWYQSGWTAFQWSWWAYIPFWLLSIGAISALARRRSPVRAGEGKGELLQASRQAVGVLLLLVLVPVITVWGLGLESTTATSRWALVGLPAFACLIAAGHERLRLPIAGRFLLPLLGALATMLAIRHDVLRVDGTLFTRAPGALALPTSAPAAAAPSTSAPAAAPSTSAPAAAPSTSAPAAAARPTARSPDPVRIGAAAAPRDATAAQQQPAGGARVR